MERSDHLIEKRKKETKPGEIKIMKISEKDLERIQ